MLQFLHINKTVELPLKQKYIYSFNYGKGFIISNFNLAGDLITQNIKINDSLYYFYDFTTVKIIYYYKYFESAFYKMIENRDNLAHVLSIIPYAYRQYRTSIIDDG